MTAQRAGAEVKRPDIQPKSTVLTEAAERGARRIALDLLASVRDARDRLDDPNDRTALHDFRVALRRLRSWLRAFRPLFSDTMRPKTERRLADIARAAGTSRDLEVHIDWVRQARRALPANGHAGAAWLRRQLRSSKRDADVELRDTIDRYFAKTTRRAESALERYEARVTDDGPRFGEAAAELIARQAVELQQALQRVSTQGDRAEAHAARIATKRLRYTLDGLASAAADVAPIVDELKAQQDTLGELHDAQQFGSALATMISTLAAEPAIRPLADRTARGAAAKSADPVIGLRMMLRRLRRAEANAFAAFQASRTGDWVTAHSERLAAIDKSLR